jgi:hypothetical protein
MTTTATRPVLDPAALYMGDNGRLFCGAVRCAGASAAFTGRCLSGQPAHIMTAQDVTHLAEDLGAPVRCEMCGMTPAVEAAPEPAQFAFNF